MRLTLLTQPSVLVLAVCRVLTREGAGRPECWFTSCDPEREIGHARESSELKTTHGAKPIRHRIEQSVENAVGKCES
jgi:hypothetical protein